MKSCGFLLVFWTVAIALPGILAVQNGDLRLTGYMSTSQAGRLEMRVDGNWRTFCSEGFNMKAAHVACRQMGLGLAMSIVNSTLARFSYPASDITVAFAGVSCNGSENHLLNCAHTRGDSCTNLEVEIFCSSHRPQHQSGDVRLVGGEFPSQGTVEVYYNGKWERPCAQGFDKESADTVCRQLGFTSAASDPEMNYRSTSEFLSLRGKWRCSESDSCVSSCFEVSDRSTCSAEQDIVLTCAHSGESLSPADSDCIFPQSPPHDGTVRLVGGVTPSEGLLEVYARGSWTTVCGRSGSFPTESAHVVCKQLGYPGVSRVHRQGARSMFTGSSGILSINYMRCDGGETSIIHCDFQNDAGTDCNAQDEVGLSCSDYSEPMYGSVSLELSSGGSGRLLVYRDGEFGSICDVGFTQANADVACKQMGFSRARSIAWRSYYDDTLRTETLLSNVSCKGDEASLLDCYHTHEPALYCTESNLVGVRCVANENEVFGGVRLVGGSDSTGIVEYGYNGVWYQICHTGLDQRMGSIVCRQLGFDGLYNISAFSGRTTRGVFGVFKCVGFESYLDDCEMSPIPPVLAQQFCINPTQIACRKEKVGEEESLRLVSFANGSNVVTGRRYGILEMYKYGRWGRVCADLFPDQAANVACKELGFGEMDKNDVWNVKHAYSSEYNILTTKCDGNEAKLRDCYYDLMTSPPCTRGAVYLTCSRYHVVPTTATIPLKRTTASTLRTPTVVSTAQGPNVGLIVGVILGVLFVVMVTLVIILTIVLLRRYYRRKKQEKVEMDWVPGNGANDNIDFQNPRYEEPTLKDPPQGPPPDYSVA